MKKLILGFSAAVGLLLPTSAAVITNEVSDVTGLTNGLARADVIVLAKGVYDVSDCMGELCGGYSSGRLSIPNGTTRTLIGAPGTKRGDVVITAPSSASRRLIYVNKGKLILTNLTLTCSVGGGIGFGNNDSRLTVTDCVFSNLTAGSAAVVSRYYATGNTQNSDVYRNCLFADNHATTGGGGCLNARGAVAYDCVFSNNTAKDNGGAVLAGSYVDCLFVSNSVAVSTTAKGGGAIGSDNAANIGFCTGCTFEGNVLEGAGHGAAIHQATALTNCVFRANDARTNSILGSGGDVVDCTFEGNTSSSTIVESGSFQRCRFMGNLSGGKNRHRLLPLREHADRIESLRQSKRYHDRLVLQLHADR